MKDTHYRELAERLYASAKGRPGDDENFYKDGGDKKPPNSYQSTGLSKLDSLVQALRPRIQYAYGSAHNELMDAALTHKMETRDFTDKEHWITIPPPDGYARDNEYPATLAHELAHWAFIRNKELQINKGLPELDNPLAILVYQLEQKEWPPRHYVEEELAAEIGATLLLDWAGGDPQLDRRAEYIANWLKVVPEPKRDEYYAKAEERAISGLEWMLEQAHMQAP